MQCEFSLLINWDTYTITGLNCTLCKHNESACKVTIYYTDINRHSTNFIHKGNDNIIHHIILNEINLLVSRDTYTVARLNCTVCYTLIDNAGKIAGYYTYIDIHYM